MPQDNTALKDLYEEFNPKLNLARDYSEFEQTMKDPSARKVFYDSFNSELKLANSYEEFEGVLGISSPKPTAPSMQGGESGAQIPPTTSTSVSETSSLGSWTTEANPLKPKVQPTQVPLAKPIDGVEQTKIVQPKLKAAELGKGLDLFQQQANQLNEEYKANPTPELEEQMKQMAINYKDTKDAYAKAMFEEKHLGGSIGKKKVEDESIASDLYNSFKAGSEALGASLANTPSFLYDVFALPQNLIAKYTGLNVGASADQFAKDYNIPKNEVAAAYTEAAKQTKAKIDKKYDKSIMEYIENGDYGKATKMIFNSVAESLPITLSLMAGNWGGVTPLASTMGGSVVFGAEKKQQLDQENPNLDEATKTSNALSTGLFEGIFENFGLTKLGGIAKEVFAKQGKEAAQDIAKQSFREVYAPLVKKYVGVGAGESISGMETQFANNVVDKYSGVKPDLDLRDGVIEAGLIGLASGGSMSAPVAAVDVFTTKQARAKAKENAAKIQSIEADIANPLVSDEVKETLSNEIGVINTEMADLKEAENELVKSVPIEKREAVAQNWRKIDALEESLPNLSDDAKKAVEAKIVELENENNLIMATPEATAGVTLNTETDGKERREEGRQEDVLTPKEEVKGAVEAAPLKEVSEITNEQKEDVNIQQQVDESKDNIGAVGDVAKENEALRDGDVESTAKALENNIELSGLNEGFVGNTYNSFDPRGDKEISDIVIEGSKSFAKTIERKGKKHRVVGLKLNRGAKGKTSGRDNYSFASIEDNGNLPSNIDEILTAKAEENIGALYPNEKGVTFNKIEGEEVAQPAKPSSSEIPSRSEEQKKPVLKVGEANKPFQNSVKVQGEETTIEMPNGETREAQFMVVELDDILASHDETAFFDTEGFPKDNGRNANSRNYKEPNAQGKVADDARNLKPSILISDNATPTDGAPIISADGIVVSGNGRTMAIKRAKSQHPEKYAEYVKALKAKAAKFGIDPKQLEGMKNPVLVKVDNNVSEYTVKEFDKYNKQSQKAESPIDEAIKRSQIIQSDAALKGKVLEIIGRHDTMSELYASKEDRKQLIDVMLAGEVILPQEKAKYVNSDGTLTDSGKDLVGDVLIATILKPKTLKATENVKQFRNKLIDALPVLSENYTLGEFSLEDEINEAVMLQNEVAAAGNQDDFWQYLKQFGLFSSINPNTVVINRLINAGKQNFKKFVASYNASAKKSMGDGLFGADDALTKQEIFERLTELKFDADERKIMENLADSPAAVAKERQERVDENVGGEQQQAQALNNPKSAKDVAVIFRSLGFDPTRAVMAARLFDAKATFMAKMRGISKEDYYKQYWITDKMDGGVAASRKGAWSKEAAKYKRLIAMYENADDSTTAHEILGHDFFDEIIELAKTNPEFEADLNTIVEEYIKETKSKKSKAEILAAVKAFDVENMKKGDIAIEVHEWFSRAAERYFVTEGNVKETSPKLKRLFELFRQRIAEIYNRLSRPLQAISEPMQEIFRKAFGKENFDAIMRMKENVDEGMIVDKLLDNTPPDSAYDDVFDALFQTAETKEQVGLGQEQRISPKQYVIEATKRAMAKGIVDYSNVIPFLEEMTNKGIGKGILTNEHYKAIAMYEDLIRNMFVAEGKKESLTARSLTNSPLVAEDVKKQMAADGIFEYTLETIAQWAKDAETLINSIGTIETYNMLVNKTLPTDKVPTALALTIGRLNNLINAAQTAKERDDLVQKQNVLAGLYVGEGTATARALNEFKILSRLHPITLAYRYKEKYKQSRDNNRRRINSAYDKMKLALDNAHKNLDYFVELNVNYEEELAKRAEEIRDLEAKLEKEKGKEYTPNRGQKTGKKLQVAGTKEFAERLAKFKAAQAAKGLGQSDLEQLSDEQYFAYGIMEAESMSFDKFVKQYNKIVGGKYELTDTEIQDLYTHARQTLFENGMHDVAEFSTDAEIFEAAEKYKTAVQKRKERLTKARVRKDMAEELAKKQVITDAKTIKKIEAAIKEKEAQILKETLDSVAQPGLWDRYVQAAMGRIIGNMASKLPSTSKEKALLDEFTALVTKEINQLVNESTDAYKPIKTTPDYASQLADLINNKEKFEQVFEEAKRQFAEKNPNANTVLQKLDNATNPFSGKLLEKALEQEAKNYTMAVKDLAYKYAGMRDSMRDQIINEIVSKTGLQGDAATELKDSLRTKFDGLIDDYKADVASTLANFVIADAKRAKTDTPKQKEYLNELLGYLRSKARDNYKAKLQKELKDPYEELRYAIETLNDQNGREIWDNSKAQVLANIEADETLSQSEKDALVAYLNDYQNAIFDQLLSKNKLYEIIRKALLDNPDFNDKSGNVAWKTIITNAGGNIEKAKDAVIAAVKEATAGYSDSEIQAVLDAVMDRFGAAIQDKKREIAQKQLEDLVKNTFKTKLGIRNKTKVRGLVEKALEFHGSELMNKTNRAGERVADTLIAEAMGLEEMTEEDWVEFDRLANNVKDTPQGNERNRAIEELASFIALKMPGSGIRKMTAKSYNVMLGRPSTIGKNSTGLLEQFTIAFSDAIRGDMQAAKIALRGMKEGDSTDVWEGGVNQGSRLDIEVNNQTGLPHVNIAKYLYNTAPSKLQKFFWSDYKLPAILDAVDAKAQKMSQNRADYLGTIDYLMNKNPGMKRKEAAKIAYENLMSGQLFEEAKREAAAEFRRRGINPTDARLKRRAYEIIRNRSVDESVRELSDIISLEDTYKTPLPASNTQSRLQQNIGVATVIGKGLAATSEFIQSGVTFSLKKAFKMDEMKAQAISEQIVKVSLLPFARGVANVAEHSLEKTPYGMVKAGIGYAYAKSAKKPVTMAEKLEQQALERMFKDKFIKSAITSAVIMAVIYGAMEALEDDWEKEDEEYKKKHRRPGIKLRTDKDTKFIDPVGVMTIPIGDRDIDIPLSMFGTMGMGTAFWKAADNAIRNRTIKKVKDPEAFLNPDAANLMLDIGDIAVGMNAYQGINDLIGYFDQDRRGRKDFAPEDYAINRAPIFVPYAGLIQQTLDSYKVLSSDNNRAQVAITPSEKAFKAFGLAGIAYDRPAIDYRGRELEMRQRNIEGIAGIAGVLKPIDFKFDEIDRYLQDIDYNPTFTKRLDEDFVNDEGYGLTKEQYYDYKKKAGQMFNELLLEFYPDIEKYTFEPTEAEIESMLAEYERKAGVSQNSALFYKNDAIVNEVETDYINKKKREMVAMLQNLAEKTAAVELGLLSDKKSTEEAKKVTDKIEDFRTKMKPRLNKR